MRKSASGTGTGENCSIGQLLEAYYGDGGKRIRGLVNQIFFSKYGGTAGRDMDEFYSVANEVFADIVKNGRYDSSKGEFNAFLYRALCFALCDELKKQKRGRRAAEGNVSLDAPVGEEETPAGDLIPSDFHMEEALEAYFGQEGDERVEQYLGSLSGIQRRIVEMKMEEVPVEEIKRRLQLTHREYKSCISSAKRNENISLFTKRASRYAEGCGMNDMIPIDLTDNYRMDKCPLGSLLDDMKDGKLNRKHILQRKPYQWTQRQKNKFLTRVLNGQPVPEIVICEQMVNGKKKSHLIDGLQRLSYSELYRGDGDVIRPEGAEFYEIPYRDYVYDEKGNVVLDEDGDAKSELKVFNVLGKKFSELPDYLKARFNKFNVNVTTFFNCSDEQIAYHIRKYNNQEGMNKNQYEFTGMSVDMAEKIKSISDMHPFFY